MALYRFLFAPVLLAVAVLLGSQHRTASRPPMSPTPPAVEAGAPAGGAEAPPVPAHARAAAMRPAPVH